MVLGSVMGSFNPNLDKEDTRIINTGFDVTQVKTDQVLGHRLMLSDALMDHEGAIIMALNNRTKLGITIAISVVAGLSRKLSFLLQALSLRAEGGAVHPIRWMLRR